jgi:hypothetical protein
MKDNAHEPDLSRRAFLLRIKAGGSGIMLSLLIWFLEWIARKTEASLRKRKLERYKASPIYPYRED